MNRIEKRQYIRIAKHSKGLRRKHAKGTFGRPPEYEMEDRKRKNDKKLQKAVDEINAKTAENSPKMTENEQKAVISTKKEVE